ncbi:MAG: Reversal of tor2 lethality [Vezdaea aestivalis]|nr:MAG: Reversal of tor2 lethality [Vezdaea aestivalis]
MLAVSTCLLLLGAGFVNSASGTGDPQLVGTWTTKSRKVVTGPAFYDPVNERLVEPELPGISYSFTQDGFYEEAYYRVLSNPTNPGCPRGMMQFQHGSYIRDPSNGSLVLSPFGVDGRQLLSDPCKAKNSVLSRYTQLEVFKRYEVITDSYHKVQRLNLFGFDGSPLQPLYLIYRPPQMLPTITMNPTVGATGSAKATGKVKRAGVEVEMEVPFNKGFPGKKEGNWELDKWWWIGLGMTAVGGVGFMFF